ncbi:MAG: hypothetical protein J7J09_08085 [Kosmotoga sp.]|nr:hypothetical protein [Kosmotoga sp.]
MTAFSKAINKSAATPIGVSGVPPFPLSRAYTLNYNTTLLDFKTSAKNLDFLLY